VIVWLATTETFPMRDSTGALWRNAGYCTADLVFGFATVNLAGEIYNERRRAVNPKTASVTV
jgi:hypothetical protein